jgi:hypothetical protein
MPRTATPRPVRVTCSKCGHEAKLQSPSDAWKCNCAAGIGPDDCNCDHLNEAEGTEDNPPDNSAEIVALEARIAELKASGQTTPAGEVEQA